jgi:hypothetical protein
MAGFVGELSRDLRREPKPEEPGICDAAQAHQNHPEQLYRVILRIFLKISSPNRKS